MAELLYSGQKLPVSKDVDIEVLAETILDTLAAGAHAWITLSTGHSEPKHVKVLIGPGIPIAVLGG